MLGVIQLTVRMHTAHIVNKYIIYIYTHVWRALARTTTSVRIMSVYAQYTFYRSPIEPLLYAPAYHKLL